MQLDNNSLFIAIFVVLIILVVLWFVPKYQVKDLTNVPTTKKEEQAVQLEKDRLRLEDDARKTLAQIIGGAVVLLGLFITFSTYILNVQKQDLDREGQMTDRFSKAIAHLGDEKLAVRIGGLYEMERIAKDSPKDLPTIKQIIYTFLHVNFSIQEQNTENNKSISEKRENSNGLAIFNYTSPNELQTIINIIQALAVENERFDLRKLNLSDKSLARGNYVLSNFSSSNLSGCVLFASNFGGADFKRANLSKATTDLKEHVEIRDSIVGLVTPEEAKAIFANADFTDAIAIESDFTEAIFLGAKLRKADLTNSIFYKANLSKAKLEGINGSQVNFKGANLTQANLTGANLTGSLFHNSKLYLTNFASADLSNAQGLSLEELKKAIISIDTKLPVEFENSKKVLLLMSESNLKTLNKELEKEIFNIIEEPKSKN